MADSAQDDEPDKGDAELERAALGQTPARSGAAAAPGTPTPKGLGRFTSFLRASWAELQRVQWPDRSQVGQATAVVIGFVAVAGAYLAIADSAGKKLISIIL